MFPHLANILISEHSQCLSYLAVLMVRSMIIHEAAKYEVCIATFPFKRSASASQAFPVDPKYQISSIYVDPAMASSHRPLQPIMIFAVHK